MDEKIKKGRKGPYLAVDPIAVNPDGEVLLMKRKKNPYEGFWVLPGGHVEYGEDPRDAVVRELKEETKVKGKIERLVGVRGKPDRDPRYHIVSICYLLSIIGGEPKVNLREGLELKYFKPDEITREMMGFDHYEMLKEARIV